MFFFILSGVPSQHSTFAIKMSSRHTIFDLWTLNAVQTYITFNIRDLNVVATYDTRLFQGFYFEYRASTTFDIRDLNVLITYAMPFQE